MTDDLEDFDPGAAAAQAMGTLEDVAAPGDQPDRDGAAGDRTKSSGDVDENQKESSGSSSRGFLAKFVLPAFLAEERGPTAATFEKHEVDGGLALILDGFTDYVLELAGRDVGDNLGPAGKIGLGVSRLKGDSSTKDQKESSGSSSSSDAGGEDDVADPFDRTEAAGI